MVQLVNVWDLDFGLGGGREQCLYRVVFVVSLLLGPVKSWFEEAVGVGY